MKPTPSKKTATAPTTKKVPSKKTEPAATTIQYDWAFRRLRAQATKYFAEHKAGRRTLIKATTDMSSFSELKSYYDSQKPGSWDEFMNVFFAHTIKRPAKK